MMQKNCTRYISKSKKHPHGSTLPEIRNSQRFERQVASFLESNMREEKKPISTPVTEEKPFLKVFGLFQRLQAQTSTNGV